MNVRRYDNSAGSFLYKAAQVIFQGFYFSLIAACPVGGWAAVKQDGIPAVSDTSLGSLLWKYTFPCKNATKMTNKPLHLSADSLS